MYMGHDFPYANPHELNLDWILERVKKNTEIFTTFDDRVKTVETEMADIVNLINAIPGQSVNPSFLTVGPSGCRFTTVTAAVEFAKTYATTNNRVCLLIAPGTYRGSVNLLGNPGIDMWSSGAFIVGDKPYPEAALYTTGRGSFTGITFQSTVDGTYGLHIEGLADASGSEQHFTNCTFTGQLSGVGIGEGHGMYQKFVDCSFYSSSPAGHAVYIHNSINDDATLCGAYFINCYSDYPFKLQKYTNYNSQLHIIARGNYFSGLEVVEGRYNEQTETYKYLINNDYVSLSGAENNLIYMNSEELLQRNMHATVAIINSGSCFIPFPNANLYDWTMIGGFYHNNTPVDVSAIPIAANQNDIALTFPQNMDSALLSLNYSLKRK